MFLILVSILSLLIVYCSSLMGSFYSFYNAWGIQDSLSLMMLWSLLWVVLIITLFEKTPSLWVTLASILTAGFYMTSSWIILFVCFELSLIPVLVMMLMKSVKPERLMASQFLLFYTVACSIPLLLLIVSFFHNWTVIMTSVSEVNPTPSPLKEMSMMAFLVKYPLFTLHSWLLKAHVEAPLEGSMFLAGALLKLGPYGLIRLINSTVPCSLLDSILIVLSLSGSVITAVLAAYSTDLKMSVAFSSISHMNLTVAGSIVLSSSSFDGMLLMLIGHSFSSCILFYSVTLSYELSGSRSPVLAKGAMGWSFVLSLMGSVSWMSNLNIPPFLGFLGELTLVMSLTSLSFILMGIVCFYGVASCFYSLFLYSVQFNKDSGMTAGVSVNLGSIVIFIASITPQSVMFIWVDLL
nr:NADH dehydrogenase subunit 4 [Linognathus vituli]